MYYIVILLYITGFSSQIGPEALSEYLNYKFLWGHAKGTGHGTMLVQISMYQSIFSPLSYILPCSVNHPPFFISIMFLKLKLTCWYIWIVKWHVMIQSDNISHWCCLCLLTLTITIFINICFAEEALKERNKGKYIYIIMFVLWLERMLENIPWIVASLSKTGKYWHMLLIIHIEVLIIYVICKA